MSSPNFGLLAGSAGYDLIEILKKWKNVVEQCRILQEQSQISFKQIQERLLALDLKKKRIRAVANEMKAQDEALLSMWEIYRDKKGHVQSVFNEVDTRYIKISESLQTIIKCLGESNMHPSLISEHHSSLVDFVDMETVTSMQSNCLIEYQSIKDIFASVERLDAELNSERSNYESRWRNVILEYSEMKEQSILSVAEPAADMANLNALCGNISSSYERLISFARSQKDKMTVTSFQAISKETENLPAFLSKALRLHTSINRYLDSLNEELARAEGVVPIFVEIFKELQKQSKSSKKGMEFLGDAERLIEERKLGIRFLFEEMENLSAWYQLFKASYDELLLEIRQRHEIFRKHQEMVDTFNRELADIYTEETSRRAAFFENFGKYLPYTLCPAIYEPSVRYHIFPERYSTNLPIIQETKANTSEKK